MNIRLNLTLILAMLMAIPFSYAQEEKTTEKKKVVIKKSINGDDVEMELKDLDDLPDDVKKKLEKLDFNWVEKGDGDIRKIRKKVHHRNENHGFLGVMMGHKIINENGVETEEGVSDLGVVIMNVVEGSPAQAAGLQADDIITAIDGTATPDHDALSGILGDKNAGDVVEVSYLRAGTAHTQNITLSSGQGYSTGQEIEIEVTEDIEPGEDGNFRKKIIIIDDGDGADVDTDHINKEIRVMKTVDDNGEEVTKTIMTITKANGEVEKTVTVEGGSSTTINKSITKQETTTKSTSERPSNDLAVNDIKLYPNPTDGLLNLRFKAPAMATTVEITDMSGKVIIQEVINNFDGFYNNQFNLNNFPKGQYVLQVRQGAKVFTEQIGLQ